MKIYKRLGVYENQFGNRETFMLEVLQKAPLLMKTARHLS